MALVETEEQASLRRTAREVARTRAPIAQLRALRDSGAESGFSRELHREISAPGWPAIAIPEQFGGAGLGYAELGIVLEELGRTLAAHTLLSSAVLSASAIALGSSDAAREALLPAIASGEQVIAFA